MGGTVLSRVLNEQHRNRASMARSFGVGRATFHGWEHARVRTPEPVRTALCDLLGWPESALFDEEGRARA